MKIYLFYDLNNKLFYYSTSMDNYPGFRYVITINSKTNKRINAWTYADNLCIYLKELN